MYCMGHKGYCLGNQTDRRHLRFSLECEHQNGTRRLKFNSKAEETNMSPRTAAAVKEAPVVAVALVVAGQFNIDALENGERRQIETLTTQLHEAKKAFADATLKMGEVLAGIQAILEPRGAFVAYLKSLGGLSKASAYRYIATFKKLKAKFPEPILNRIIAAGLPVYSTSTAKRKEFGNYTKAIKRMKLPQGPLTETKADEFVQALQEKQRTLRIHAVAKTPKEHHADAVKYVLWRFNKIAETERLAWLQDVFSDIGANVGLTVTATITPAAAETPARGRAAAAHA